MNSPVQKNLTLDPSVDPLDSRNTLGNRILDSLWDLWCVASVVGWWPRFVEPNLIKTIRNDLPIQGLSTDLDGLRILHFSDLHFSEKTPTSFLRRLLKRIESLSPDLILFTGDFICYSALRDIDRLQYFFSALEAPHGVYCTYGNHDYASYVSKLPTGSMILGEIPKPLLAMIARRFFAGRRKKTPSVIPDRGLEVHPILDRVLRSTDVRILDNEVAVIPIGESGLNVCGVGDYWAGRCRPQEAFEGYRHDLPGVVLSHNPDSVQLLKEYPGDLILSGHTHGGQVNLPLVRRFLASPMEFPQLKSGMCSLFGKRVYVTQGVGSHIPFRWFAPPDISIITLRAKGE
jgi:predicted MPP superfamily phosphohydrolase